MTKPKKYSTRLKTGLNTQSLWSARLSPLSKDYEEIRNSEARTWIQMRKKKVGEVGLEAAQSWWETVKVDIERIRGKQGLDDLIRRMYEQSGSVRDVPLPSVGSDH